jgi:hypothetical protein
MDKNLVQIAIDAYKGHVAGNYSVDDSMKALREALVELNGGSTKLDYKAIRDGKCNGVFALVEEIITKTVIEGLPDTCPLFDYVDFRNLALGDSNVFEIKDAGLFVVADMAEGTQGIRRQRVVGGEEIPVKTQVKGIKIYEELNRVLAGRIDFNELIDRVAKSFNAKINTDMYNAVVGGFNGLVSPYKDAGAFDETKLAEIIDHVEAATGKTAVILGSKQAVRKITGVTGADANSAKEDLYNLGYFGKFHTTPIIAMNNAHKVGGTEFVLGNDLYIIAGDDKFIKLVHEGDTLIINGDPLNNADLSMEYLLVERYGVATAFAEQFGVYQLA